VDITEPPGPLTRDVHPRSQLAINGQPAGKNFLEDGWFVQPGGFVSMAANDGLADYTIQFT
jgi:hypothetical protein